jgi:hypothetical protein
MITIYTPYHSHDTNYAAIVLWQQLEQRGIEVQIVTHNSFSGNIGHYLDKSIKRLTTEKLINTARNSSHFICFGWPMFPLVNDTMLKMSCQTICAFSRGYWEPRQIASFHHVFTFCDHDYNVITTKFMGLPTAKFDCPVPVFYSQRRIGEANPKVLFPLLGSQIRTVRNDVLQVFHRLIDDTDCDVCLLASSSALHPDDVKLLDKLADQHSDRFKWAKKPKYLELSLILSLYDLTVFPVCYESLHYLPRASQAAGTSVFITDASTPSDNLLHPQGVKYCKSLLDSPTSASFPKNDIEKFGTELVEYVKSGFRSESLLPLLQKHISESTEASVNAIVTFLGVHV